MGLFTFVGDIVKMLDNGSQGVSVSDNKDILA